MLSQRVATAGAELLQSEPLFFGGFNRPHFGLGFGGFRG